MLKKIEHHLNLPALTFLEAGKEDCVPYNMWGPGERAVNVIHFVKSGAGVYNINNEQQIVSENQCFLVPRGVTTFWQADGIKPWDYWWICFLGQDVPELLESCGFDGQHYVLTLEDATPIWDSIDTILTHADRAAGSGLIIQAEMLRIFACLQQNSHQASKQEEPADSYIVQRAIQLVNDHVSDGITVKELAERLYISRTKLNKIFREDMGVSPHDFIIHSRMAKAGELLSKTNMSIAEISKIAGYDTPFSFSRAWKQHFGVPPAVSRTQKNDLTQWGIKNMGKNKWVRTQGQ